MPRIRHRKRGTARVNPVARPTPIESEESVEATGSNSSIIGGKKVGKKELEVTNLLVKLKSVKLDERIWAASALGNLLLEVPSVTLRLLLSNNLIGLLIERLSDSNESVKVECLGALRNLIVSSEPSILSEMVNKRLLLPLLTIQLPFLQSLLPAMLLPPNAPHTAPLSSTPSQRESIQILNDQIENTRKLYWDWVENLITIIWCCAESNLKILSVLNGSVKEIIEFLSLFLEPGSIGLEDFNDQDGMEGVTGKGKGKKTKKVEKKERVPIFIALVAAQTLQAFTSTNPSALALLNPLIPSLTQILTTQTPPTYISSRTESHHSSPESDLQDYLSLRILCFGIILEMVKSGKGKKRNLELMKFLKEEQSVLLGGLETDLKLIAQTSINLVEEIKTTTATPNATPTGPTLKLSTIEKKLTTLQSSLEILTEWSTFLDTDSLSKSSESEEEWGGIMNDLEEIANNSDEEGEGESDEMEQDDQMDRGDDQEEEEEQDFMGSELSSNSIELLEELPKLLLKLSIPTIISFYVPTSTAPVPGFIPTATTTTPQTLSTELSSHLIPISELLTTIHVRALETLNNLFITLARTISTSNYLKSNKNVETLQIIWENILELILGASTLTSVAKVGEGEDRGCEMVMAGIGAIWGIARVGLGETNTLTVTPQTTTFLIELFSHPFALINSPVGEAIRVRIIGTLGWIGRRIEISAEENQMIGNFLLNLLPGKTLTGYTFTMELLLQIIDSIIDIYSDEDSNYDIPVFRSLSYLTRLSTAVPGVRAATKKVDKKKFPELRTRADGALENLEAFISYRKSVEAAAL